MSELERLCAENTKLRELAKEMWSVMWACAEERCTHRKNGCYRVSGNGTTPKEHGECWFKQRMRDLGVEGRRMNMPSSEVRSGEPVLVEVAIPLERIETVRCDFDGIYHVQVFGEEVVTDEETYRRVVEVRDAHLRRTRELGVEA